MRGRFAPIVVIAVAAVMAVTAGMSHAVTLPPFPPKTPPVVAPPAPGPVTVDYGYDAAHDFAAADPTIAPPLGSLWSVALKGDPVQLLAADKMTFALVARPSAADLKSTYLLALDPATGHTIWNLLVPNGSQIAYESGVVAVAGGDHVQAFKASSGSNLWNVALAGAAALTPAGGQLYVDAAGDTTTAQEIAAIDLGSGKVAWSAKPPSPEGAGPLAVAGDRLYRAEGNQAQAFNRTNGKLIWQVKTNSTITGAATAELWNQRLFTPPFAAGAGAPATTAAAGPLSDATGSALTGETAAITSGATGLQATPQGTIANDLATGTLIWSAYTHPLAIVNDQAVTRRKNAIELRSLASGKVSWHANMTGSADDVTAVGNGQLLVGTAGHLTALLAYGNSAVPKVTTKALLPYATYHGPPAKVTGTIAQPGIEQSYEFALAGRRAGAKGFGKPRLTHSKPDGTLKLSVHPRRNTLYRISLPGSAVALSLFEIVALPKISYDFGTPAGNKGKVTITLLTPPGIHLGGRKTSLYLGRPTTKHYLLLGTGTLHGKTGRFRAEFPFKLEKHVRKTDFVTACFTGLYRQGMSYGDRLDRRCGASKIGF